MKKEVGLKKELLSWKKIVKLKVCKVCKVKSALSLEKFVNKKVSKVHQVKTIDKVI